MQSWSKEAIVFGAHLDDAEIAAGGMITQERVVHKNENWNGLLPELWG